MKVYVRDIGSPNAVPFAEVEFFTLPGLIAFIKQSGGFEIPGAGPALFHSYQLVLDEGEAYAEILVGEEN
jgi:hypothetical protein